LFFKLTQSHENGKLEVVLVDGALEGVHVAPDDPGHHDGVGDESGDQAVHSVLPVGDEDGTDGPDNTDKDVAGEGIGGGLEGFLIFGKVDDGEFGGHFDGADRGLDTCEQDGLTKDFGKRGDGIFGHRIVD